MKKKSMKWRVSTGPSLASLGRTSFSPSIVFCHFGDNWPRRDVLAVRNDVMLGRASDVMTSGVADER